MDIQEMKVDKSIDDNIENLKVFNDMCKEIIPCIEKMEKICNGYEQEDIYLHVYGDGKYLEFSGMSDFRLVRSGNAEYKIESKFKVV